MSFITYINDEGRQFTGVALRQGSAEGLADLQIFSDDQNGSVLKTDVVFDENRKPGTWGPYRYPTIIIRGGPETPAAPPIEPPAEEKPAFVPPALRIVEPNSAEIPSGGLGTPPPQPAADVGGSEILAPVIDEVLKDGVDIVADTAAALTPPAEGPQPKATEIAPAPEEPSGNPASTTGPAQV